MTDSKSTSTVSPNGLALTGQKAIEGRIDGVFVVDVRNGNPNGDPDNENMPRTNPISGRGLISHVSIKRKLRNRVEKLGVPIFVRHGIVMAEEKTAIYDQLGLKPGASPKATTKKKGPDIAIPDNEKVRNHILSNFWDVRAFGGVMSQDVDAGQVRGAAQVETFAESIDPITTDRHLITAGFVQSGARINSDGGTREFGSIPVVNGYAAYMGRFSISAAEAEKNGFGQDDLDLFLNALANLYGDDDSSARFGMTVQKIVLFRHNSKLGSGQAGKLFRRVTMRRNSTALAPDCFEDYDFNIDTEGLPTGVRVEILDCP